MHALRTITSILTALTIAQAAPALAHPKLVSSVPAAASSVAGPRQISLKFNERLMRELSGIEVAPAAMAGMDKMTHADHAAPMAMPSIPAMKTSFSADNKTLIARFASALPQGSYKVTWHGVSADTHRIEGSYTFSVR